MPNTLWVRLVLIMFGSVLIAQLVSAVVSWHDRQELGSRFAAFDWSERIGNIAAILATVDPDQREAELDSLRSTSPQALLSSRSYSSSDYSFLRQFQESVKARPHPGFELQISTSQSDRMPNLLMGSFNDFPASGRPAYADVTVTFARGPPLIIRLELLHRSVGPPLELYVYPLALLGALLLGALLLARGVTRPLAKLSSAADALGRGLPHEPLPETGPRELRRAAHAFNSMRDRLERYLDSRTRVLAAMSHDLRTPITRLRLRAEGLAPNAVQEPFIRDLDSMQQMVQEALHMLEGLQSNEAVQRVDLGALVSAIRDDYSELGLPIEVRGEITHPVSCRPVALRRLFSNLLDNARRYAHQVWIDIEDRGFEVECRVADDGPGIAPAELERVMEPYYRLESSRDRATGGTGLGLSIARDIAQAHGGRLALHNRSQGGLEAVFTLPQDQ